MDAMALADCVKKSIAIFEMKIVVKNPPEWRSEGQSGEERERERTIKRLGAQH